MHFQKFCQKKKYETKVVIVLLYVVLQVCLLIYKSFNCFSVMIFNFKKNCWIYSNRSLYCCCKLILHLLMLHIKKDCLTTYYQKNMLPYYKTLLFLLPPKVDCCYVSFCLALSFYLFFYFEKKIIKIKTDKNSQFLVLFDFFFCNRPTKEFNTNIKVVLCVH